MVLSTSPLVAVNVKLTTGNLELSKSNTCVPLVEFNLNVKYIQANNTAIDIQNTSMQIRYTMNIYDEQDEPNSLISLNHTIPSAISTYRTGEEAMQSLNTIIGDGIQRNFYLKHKLENGIVKESYVEFIVTEDLAQKNPGMVAGTYTIRGGIDESSLAENKQEIFLQNIATINRAFGDNICPLPTTYQNSFNCYTEGLNAGANASGAIGVDAYVDYGTIDVYCAVDPDGSSYCMT